MNEEPVIEGGDIEQSAYIGGWFHMTMSDETGEVVADEEFHNLWLVLGKELVLNQGLTATTCFFGVINGGTAVTLSTLDTAASHLGWTENGQYTGNRPSVTFSGAGASGNSGTIAAGNQVITMDASGTLAGLCVIGGTGATNTISSTGGTLVCEGTIGGGTQYPFVSGYAMTLGYGLTLT